MLAPNGVWGAAALAWSAFWLHDLAGQENLADVVERSERAVVKILVDGEDGGGLGSGFLVDRDGTLVTNVHVLAGARRAIAEFPNGVKREVLGTLLFDAARDICIAKIDGEFPTLPIARELPRKGERVTALGSPKGLSFSATTGIVSAIRPAAELGPEIGRPEIKGTWIQVDAALSGGNSGGPLINDRGEVVGMSTLASQGSAQNLNFGISAADIREAFEASRKQSLVALTDGIAKLKSEDHAGGGMGPRPEIPLVKLERYVTDCRANFKEITRDMRRELTRMEESLREMKKGEPFLPQGAPLDSDVVRLVNTRTKRTQYFFRSDGVKDREVSRMQTRVKDLDAAKDAATDPANNAALLQLLSTYGPRLDPRRAGSIGFMSEAIVATAFDDQGVVIVYDDTPFLLWVESAAGLTTGSELTPAPVYVAGTQTIAVPGRGTQVVTLLQTVTETDLRNAIFGGAPTIAGEWRVWKDDTGKFEIEATLVEVDDQGVLLKKRDGTTIKVPLGRLSASDRQSLGK